MSSLTYALSVVKCDLIADYHIDAKDLGVIADNWLADCLVDDCNSADLDDSNTVNLTDFALFAPHWQTDPNLVYRWKFVEQQLDDTMNELINNSTYLPDYNYPRSTDRVNGTWVRRKKGDWTCGFWPGALWYMYQRTSEQKWKNWAESWTNGLVNEPNRTGDHEAGFTVYRSYGLGYRITGNPAYKPRILKGCISLATRYNSKVGCIESWNSYKHYDGNNYTFPVITDGMMMLEMLFWGAKNGGNSNWYNIAVSHATKTMENNVRPNGSTWQIVAYNESTGAVLAKMNKQGYRDWSTWSRGQAWGIYGFTMTYRETLDPNFLTTAKKYADYFVDHLPADHVPYWDFNDPNIPNSPRDSSAAAIAASGLLELSTYVSEPSKGKYQNAAINILDSLASLSYLADDTNSMGILLHGTGNGRNKDPVAGDVDVSLIYGDHFFIEALMRYEDLFY